MCLASEFISSQHNKGRQDEMTRQQEGGTLRDDATTSQPGERTRGWRGAHREGEERRCNNKLAR